LEDHPRTKGLRNYYSREYERLEAKIGQFADKRKAQLDRELAN
jgi:hypothetical protein